MRRRDCNLDHVSPNLWKRPARGHPTMTPGTEMGIGVPWDQSIFCDACTVFGCKKCEEVDGEWECVDCPILPGGGNPESGTPGLARLLRATGPMAPSRGGLSAVPTTSAGRRCRWVWRHGLVCETEITTVNP